MDLGNEECLDFYLAHNRCLQMHLQAVQIRDLSVEAMVDGLKPVVCSLKRRGRGQTEHDSHYAEESASLGVCILVTSIQYVWRAKRAQVTCSDTSRPSGFSRRGTPPSHA